MKNIEQLTFDCNYIVPLLAGLWIGGAIAYIICVTSKK